MKQYQKYFTLVLGLFILATGACSGGSSGGSSSVGGGLLIRSDAPCESIIKACEARTNVPAWQSVMEVGSTKLEALKANGQYYMRRNGGEWKKTVSIDDTERDFVAQMKSGQIKLSDCKNEGSEMVEGVDTNVITYQIEMPGAPAARSKLRIGKADGLPYAQSSDTMKAGYQYKNVAAPNL